MNRRTFIKSSLGTGLVASGIFRAAALMAKSEDKNDRVARLLAGVSGLPPREICFARARLMTESYCETAGEAPILRKAKAFYRVADGMPILIQPGELIVGNIASKPRVAYFAPESYDWTNYRDDAEQVLKSDLVYQQDIRFRIPEEIARFWRKMPHGDTAGHFVADYSKVLRLGFSGLAAEAKQNREKHRRAGTLDVAKENFYQAAEIVCRAASRFAHRHAEAARTLAQAEPDPSRRTELQRIAMACDHAATQPAQNFHEALQAFWFTHVLLHINSSEWSISPGRFDQYMWPSYEQDIAAGRLTRDEAAEWLACLWIKFNEVRVCAVDIINYQNLMIGGVDQAGRDATNDLSHLCLETTFRLRGLTQPSLSLRWHPGAPEQLLLRAGALILTGSGRPALFNDRVCIPALERAGVRREDVWDYSIAGCEELAAAGRVFGVCRCGTTNQAQCVLNALRENPASFDDLLQAYQRHLSLASRRAIEGQQKRDERSARHTPHPFVSLLFDDCLRDGKDIAEGGARYNISSLAEAGTITAANSLYAIKRCVYEQKRTSVEELNRATAANFEGHAQLHALLRNAPKFGNDDDRMDQFARDIVKLNQRVLDELNLRDYRNGRIVPGSGISTAWKAGHYMGATPDGRVRGQALSISLGPSAGTERHGPTAALNSVAKLDWQEQAGGALTHIQLPYTATRAKQDTANLKSLIAGFFHNGGMGVHFSVVDVDLLRQAMKEPEKHLHILVRMGGYSAQFALLAPQLQRDIIARMEQP
ncbi:MAG: hypothetical protein FJ395_02345 [Verrucomicrobia bacterium]|nr:hypothetical protein [Verrucomicrobiota bacterium]